MTLRLSKATRRAGSVAILGVALFQMVSPGWAQQAQPAQLPQKGAETAPAQQPAAGGRYRGASAIDVKSITSSLKVPAGFNMSVFGIPPTVHYPTSISATPTGDLFVAVDENGSLDAKPDRGRVLKCVDTDGDGVADKITVFATMDSPRGVIWNDGVLYVLHPPFLTAYYDDNNTGVSNRSVDLISGLGRDLKFRGADHTTNGIRLGIDGWIYIAQGDYGTLKATGKDGTELQIHGGGVDRVRTDGSGLERFSIGQRNIYDVAIDPLMNVYTRDNTNDGDAWNDRLSYIVPTGYYGYPSRFVNFPGEIIDALADYGGGSPCGSLFIDEPGLPNGLFTVEWGRNEIDRHAMTPNGANFKAGMQKFMDFPKGTDMDVDGQGHIFLASWLGASFNYVGESVGYVVRLTPKDFKAAPFPNLKAASDEQLLKYLASPSAVCRQATQQMILKRGDKPVLADGLVKLAGSREPLAARVAAIFTLEQLRGGKASEALVQLAAKDELREFALHALADRKNDNQVPAKPFLDALNDNNPRVRLVAAWCLGRLGRSDAAAAILPHVADADPLVSHIAVQSLTALHAYDVCLKAVDSSTPKLIPGALRVLQELHETQVVDGLNDRLAKLPEPQLRSMVYAAFCRLYFREADWDGTWWGTRPDTSGPYFKTASWPGTDRVKQILQSALNSEKPEVTRSLVIDLQKHKVEFPEVGQFVAKAAAADPEFRTMLVNMLIDRPKLSADQVELLKQVAVSEKETPALRAKAISALQKDATSPGATNAAADALALVYVMPKPDSELAAVLTQYLRDPRNGRNIAGITKLTESTDVAHRDLGYGVLLSMMTQPQAGGRQGGGGGGRGQQVNPAVAAGPIIERAWSKPESTVSLLHAIAHAHTEAYNQQVMTLQKDSHPQVATAATAAANELGLNRNAGGAAAKDLIENLPYETVVSDATKSKGDMNVGAPLFVRQGCVACHTVKSSETPKGPFLGGVAARYSRADLCESILKPSAKIAQGFETQYFKTADGDVVEGFVSKESGDQVEYRDATGILKVLKKSDITARGTRKNSMMPEGLVAKLTPQDLSNLLAYLESLKAN